MNSNSEIMAHIWPDYVNFERRRQVETPFLAGLLSEFDNPRIFNAALGTGETTIGLYKAGLTRIVSNELEPNFRRVAIEQARKYCVPLEITTYDWRSIPEELSESVDAIVCLGNSLTCLFNREDQLRALQNFYRMLRAGGKMIIDERNYAHHFQPGKFRFSGNSVYFGADKVDVWPSHISNDRIVLEYRHKVTGERTRLEVYPFKEGELRGLLEAASFRDIEVYGDYQRDFDPEEPEFLTYAGRK